jgi:hypothetical protein
MPEIPADVCRRFPVQQRQSADVFPISELRELRLAQELGGSLWPLVLTHDQLSPRKAFG